LLSFIFAILSQISSLVVDEAFTIELLGNLFSLYNKIFLLIFFFWNFATCSIMFALGVIP